jgi:hypothetical protein
LEQILNLRTNKGVNEFVLYNEPEYLYLVLLVNKDYTYLHYYSQDDHPGFRSMASDNGLDDNDTSIFYTNTDKEEVSIPNDSIMSFNNALIAVKAFFETGDMPKSIEWDEL